MSNLQPVTHTHPLQQLEDARRTSASRKAVARLRSAELTLNQLRTGRLRDDRLGHPSVEAVRARHDFMATVIDADVAAGSGRHRRMPRIWRGVPPLVAVLDLAVLFTFLAAVFNVALDAPATTPIPTLAASALAVIGSGPAYVWLAVTGDRLRSFRGDTGGFRWRLLDGTTWFLIATSALLIGTLAMLMSLRVVGEALQAGGIVGAAATRPLGAAFAVFSVVANLAVIAIHALDGSHEGEELRHAGKVLRRHELAVQAQERSALGARSRLQTPVEDAGAAGEEGATQTG